MLYTKLCTLIENCVAAIGAIILKVFAWVLESIMKMYRLQTTM